MEQLIDKKAITESRDILDTMELLELTPYISAESLIKFVDGLPYITEAEIMAKAIYEFAKKLKTECRIGSVYVGGEIRRMIDELAKQLKEELNVQKTVH